MLMTLDLEGEMLPVPVRVGQAVDTVAQVQPVSALLKAPKADNPYIKAGSSETYWHLHSCWRHF